MSPATTTTPPSPTHHQEHPVPTTPPETMSAIVQRAYGGPEVFQLGERAVPDIADDELLVEVHAAGMDRGTWHVMTGLPRMVRPVFGLRRPKQPVPGLDVAGTVVAVGAEVTRFEPGDEVFGIAKGSFAQYAAAKEAKLAPKPAGATWEQAAVVPVSGLTAIQAVRTAGVQPGQRVLVLGASGGVGSYAVQVAKADGAEVTGVASGAKLDFVRSLGADHVVDHTREDPLAEADRYDVIVDIGGRPSLGRLRRSLTRDGHAVIVGGEGGGSITGGFGRSVRAALLSPFVRQTLTMFVSKERHDELLDLAELIEAGQVTPAVDRSYPLAEVAEAMRRLDDGEVRGKIAITV